MKPLIALLIALSVPAHADGAKPNGYDQLVAAAKLMLPGENGTPSTVDTNLTPVENLRRQRVAIARNALALALIREALKQPITLPIQKDYVDLSDPPYAAFRELARQFMQESAVRSADGDWAGSLDSHLTIVELGAAITPGASLIGMLTGEAIEAIGRHDLDKIVAHLDAPTLKAALERFQAIDTRRASFADVTQVEKQISLNLTLLMFKNEKDVKAMKEKLSTPEGRKQFGVTDAQATEMLTFTPESMTADISAAFDAVLARDRLSYSEAKKTVLPPAKGMFTKMWISTWVTVQPRFPYERNLTEDRLLEGALKLREIKLEKGVYPADFATQTDPFGDNTKLVYRRDGDGYLLYSVGPDGKDDDGEELQSLETNPETGIKKVTSFARENSTGDIAAPIF